VSGKGVTLAAGQSLPGKVSRTVARISSGEGTERRAVELKKTEVEHEGRKS